MRALLIIDLLTLLPLFAVGGVNALWWLAATAGTGAVGALCSLQNLRSSIKLASTGKTGFKFPRHALIAIGSVLLILPGLASDLIGVMLLLACIATPKYTRGHYSSHASSTSDTRPKQVIDVEYSTVHDPDKGKSPHE